MNFLTSFFSAELPETRLTMAPPVARSLHPSKAEVRCSSERTRKKSSLKRDARNHEEMEGLLSRERWPGSSPSRSRSVDGPQAVRLAFADRVEVTAPSSHSSHDFCTDPYSAGEADPNGKGVTSPLVRPLISKSSTSCSGQASTSLATLELEDAAGDGQSPGHSRWHSNCRRSPVRLNSKPIQLNSLSGIEFSTPAHSRESYDASMDRAPHDAKRHKPDDWDYHRQRAWFAPSGIRLRRDSRMIPGCCWTRTDSTKSQGSLVDQTGFSWKDGLEGNQLGLNNSNSNSAYLMQATTETSFVVDGSHGDTAGDPKQGPAATVTLGPASTTGTTLSLDANPAALAVNAYRFHRDHLENLVLCVDPSLADPKIAFIDDFD